MFERLFHGVLLLGCALHALAADPRPSRLDAVNILQHLQPNPMGGVMDPSHRELLEGFYVTQGFRVDLIARDPELVQPIAFTFDALGRLWVLEALSYPERQRDGEGKDRLLIFEDFDGDGSFENRKVFVDGLNLASGFELGFGGVWVGAAPQLLFIPDRDGDDEPDGPAEVVLDGFGYQDTHETLNNFIWGPDGWLYGLQGVFNASMIGLPGSEVSDRVAMRAGVWRFHPIRKVFEVFAHGGSNQWGLDFDQHGEWFMTHCRSFWGGGPTTHVMQGGHYWNQANDHYPDFIESSPPEGLASFRNYLMASARYGHGEGGAGSAGSSAIYGGHAHVGTLIYQGDQWPEPHRHRLYTHNLHGRQMNVQTNLPDGSSYQTVHAGADFLYHVDPSYLPVDLKTGPDGSVYFNDWADLQHCHHPNHAKWNRSSGRLYRIVYQDRYQPHLIDLHRKSDRELAWLHLHRNNWHVRMARRLLMERASMKQAVDPEAVEVLRQLSLEHANENRRLRALWTLHCIGAVAEEDWSAYFRDASAEVRGWAVSLVCDAEQLSPALAGRLVQLASSEASPKVLLRLASVLPAMEFKERWSVLENLTQKVALGEDRMLRSMIWFGLAQSMRERPELAFDLLQGSKPIMPVLHDWIPWYAAKLKGSALDLAMQFLVDAPAEDQAGILASIFLGLRHEQHVPMPRAWVTAAQDWTRHPDREIRYQAENLAALFGDRSLIGVLRGRLVDPVSDGQAIDHALDLLQLLGDRAAPEIYLRLLEQPVYRAKVLSILGSFDEPQVAATLLTLMPAWPVKDQQAALEILSARSSYARMLLDAIEGGQWQSDQVNAHILRRLQGLNEISLQPQLERIWGIGSSMAPEKLELVGSLEKRFAQAPLWAYDLEEGRKHFQLLCQSCHGLEDDNLALGPRLSGSGSLGVGYFLEAIMDPNAVVGRQYQMTQLVTQDGKHLTGLLKEKGETAWVLQTIEGMVKVPLDQILSQETSSQSLMPVGLLDGLNDREKIELLKFLVSL